MYICVRCGIKVKLTEQNTRPVDGAPPEKGPPNEIRPQQPPPQNATAGSVNRSREVIGQQLIKAGLINVSQLEEALSVQRDCGGKTFEILISLGHLDKDDIHRFLATKTGHASIGIANYQIPRDVLDLVPKEIAVENVLLPIDKLGKLLTIGMACPLDSVSLQHIQETTGLKVKAVLCKLDEIRGAIRQYFPDTAKFSFDGEEYIPQKIEGAEECAVGQAKILALIERVEDLPVHVQAAQRLKAQAGNATIRDAINIICSDPLSAIRILTMANSTAYSMPNRVDNVGTAGALIGLEATMKAVVGAPSTDYFKKQSPFDYRALWNRSTFCAGAAQAIAKLSGKGHLTTAYSAGLLLDIGRLILCEILPQSYAAVCRDLSGMDLVRREASVYGLSHTEVGYLLAKRWGFPPALTEAIKRHHEPEQAGDALDTVNVTALAATMTDLRELGQEVEVGAFKGSPFVFKHLGIKRHDAVNIFKETASILASTR